MLLGAYPARAAPPEFDDTLDSQRFVGCLVEIYGRCGVVCSGRGCHVRKITLEAPRCPHLAYRRRNLALLSDAVAEQARVAHVGEVGVLALLLNVDGAGMLARLLYVGDGGLVALVVNADDVGALHGCGCWRRWRYRCWLGCCCTLHSASCRPWTCGECTTWSRLHRRRLVPSSRTAATIMLLLQLPLLLSVLLLLVVGVVLRVIPLL